MARRKAVLVLDPARAGEQLAYVAERAEIIHRAGDQLWVSLADEQVARFASQGIVVQVREDADTIQVPAGSFDPVVALPEPPAELRAADGSGIHQLVQFVAPPDPAWIAAIGALGPPLIPHPTGETRVFRLREGASAASPALTFD